MTAPPLPATPLAGDTTPAPARRGPIRDQIARVCAEERARIRRRLDALAEESRTLALLDADLQLVERAIGVRTDDEWTSGEPLR